MFTGKKFPHETSILNLGTYISMFPQLIAGPIVRYEQIKEQLNSTRIDSSGIANGARLFILGLTYKVLIADTFADTADYVFSLDPKLISTPLAWLGAISYFFQIYFDFNGYSVMAIGIGKMLGFTFPRNFDRPYISRSITEFWQRWHISLSSWFRDYLYIPLGGSRVSPTVTYRNLFSVFILCGIWHGAGVKFLVWGVFHGCFLVFERVLKPIHLKLPAVVSHLYTILVIMIGWILFRIDSVYEIMYYWGSMAGFPEQSVYMYQEKASLFTFVLIFIAAVLSTVRIDYNNPPLHKQRYSSAIAYSTLFLASVLLLISRTHSPFIYFRF